MEVAFLLARSKGVDLSGNQKSASVIALVNKGYLAEDLALTECGQIFVHLIEGVAKDVDRMTSRMIAKAAGK